MSWNVFKFCTALRGLGSIMIIIVLGIVGVSYYAVVVVNYWPALLRGGLDSLFSLAVLLPFHFLLGMLLWSYFSAILTDPGGVPPNWRPVMDEETGDSEHLNNSDYNSDSGVRISTMGSGSSDDKVRFCRKCNQFKPPRCHHCSVCQRCILKMDHHCVWIVNCVGALNYKFFNLFLLYTFLETTLVSLSLLPYFMAFFTDEEIYGTPGTIAVTFITFVLNVAFSLSLLGFLVMHGSLVAKNKTTIEAFEKKTTSKWCYDLGWKKNMEQVFGSNKLYWFIPAYTEEDIRLLPALRGIEFPVRPDLEALRQF